MTTLAWIVASGLLMSVIALSGSLALLLSERTLDRLLLPLVGFARPPAWRGAGAMTRAPASNRDR